MLLRAGAERSAPTQVKITKPFYLAMYQVTQGEYEKVMGVNPSAFTAKQMECPRSSRRLPEADRRAGEGCQEGERQGHQPPSRGDGQLGGGDGVLPQTFGNARRASRTTGLSSADRSRVGVCLPRGNDNPLVLRRRRGGIG